MRMTRRAPKRPTQRQLEDGRSDLMKAVARNVDSWDAIWRHAQDWQRGYPSGHRATTAVTGDEDTVTVSQPDVGLEATMWCFRWQEAVALVLKLADQSQALNPKQPKVEDARTSQATVAPCEGCGRTVANTSVDRIKSGFCPRCYTDWQRKKGLLDRLEFVKQRRAMLGADLGNMGTSVAAS